MTGPDPEEDKDTREAEDMASDGRRPGGGSAPGQPKPSSKPGDKGTSSAKGNKSGGR